MPTIEELRDAYGLATEKLNDVNQEMRREIHAAKTRIEADYRDRLVAASLAATAANRAVLEEDARLVAIKAATHPLVGKKVTAIRRKRNSLYRSDTERWFGIIEVITEASEQPTRRGYYSEFPTGHVVVRLLNAKGKPLKTVERLTLRDQMREKYSTANWFKELDAEEQEARLEQHWVFVD